jgi:hypothetical protein
LHKDRADLDVLDIGMGRLGVVETASIRFEMARMWLEKHRPIGRPTWRAGTFLVESTGFRAIR